MGRFLTLLVGGMLFGISYLLFSGQRASYETRENQSDHQFTGIASNIVQSGFNRGLSAIQRDLMDVSETFDQVTMADGYYDLTVAKAIYGELDLHVDARSGGAVYDVASNLIFTSALPAAVLLEDEEVAVSGSGFYQISGVDQRMPTRGSGAGFNEPARGIITKYSHMDAFTNSLRMDRVLGIGDSPGDPVKTHNVAGGFEEEPFEALYQEARLNAHTTISAFTVPLLRESMVMTAAASSSPDDPRIIRVQGDLAITQSMQGYGMLLIEDGNLDITAPDFDWEGLILIRKHFVDTVRVTLQNTTVHGGVIAYDYDPATSLPECVPDFDLNDDEVTVNEAFRVRFKVLGAAIVNGNYDQPVTTRLNMGGTSYEPWGDYDLALDGNVNTGNSGITYGWEPDIVFDAGTTISVDSKSWVKIDGEDGSDNSEWEVHMERNSLDEDNQLKVLKNGSSVPSVGGFEGQYSVVEFLADYIANDKAKLTANQVVNLFEIGVTDESSAAFDMQDNVVLTTLVRAGEAACQAGGSDSRLEVAIRDNTQIHYSSEAIAKLGKHLDTIEYATEVKVTETVIKGHGKDETPIYATNITPDDHQEPDATGSGTVTVCYQGQNKLIKEIEIAKFIGRGAYVGSCGTIDDLLEDLVGSGECSGDDDDGILILGCGNQ